MIFSISNGFIKRPILAVVCSALVALFGILALPNLPVEQLPPLAPTRVSVSAAYPGADAATVESAVTTILERELNSLKGVDYISSTSNNGSSTVNVVFDDDRDEDLALVEVQNKVANAESRLPDIVQQTGVTVSAQSTSLLMVYRLYLTDDTLSSTFLSNYTDIYLVDALRRIDGVGGVQLFGGSSYAMRIWLDPGELARRGLTVQDVTAAIREQNRQVPVGIIGASPALPGQTYEIPLRVKDGRLTEAPQFEEIVVGQGTQGELVLLREVGAVELGAEDYSTKVLTSGQPGVGVGVYLAGGSNALEVATAVKEVLKEVESSFPDGIASSMVFDTTEFVRLSLREVVIALLQAVGLVVLILFFFLRNIRATLVPALAIPVSLVGAAALMYLSGLSINTFTLLGCILAAGLVVDDAIVVVEAISAKIASGLTPRAAARSAMAELSGAVISTSLVLAAVFLPVAFFPGTTGKIYQQFALTIVFTIVFSTFNALTFSPSVSARLLAPQESVSEGGAESRGIYERVSAFLLDVYGRLVMFSVRGRYLVMLLFGALLVTTLWLSQLVPSGFIPEEDQGYLIGIVQAPQGVSLEYTEEVIQEVGEIVRSFPQVESDFAVAGFSFGGASSNQGLFFVSLKPWSQRQAPDQSVQSLVGQLNGRFFSEINSATVLAFNAPPVSGLGSVGGFEVQIVDGSGGQLTLDELYRNTFEILGGANQSPALAAAFTQFTADTPQIELSIDRQRLKALGVQFSDVADTLSAYLGSRYVNDFDLGQRSYRVIVQAKPEFRDEPDDLGSYYVRSSTGELVSLDQFVSQSPVSGPQSITHHDLQRSISVQGQAAPGVSTGDALEAMRQVIEQVKLPVVGFDWVGTAREELASGAQSLLLFGFGIVVVFLVLAALYDSLVDPLIILLTVPLAVFGALLFLHFRGLTLNVYARVGMVMLVGLASKNAILIVEYANAAMKDGLSVVDAAVAAAQQRVRPIVMTAISSLMGFLPLVVATGAGAASRWAIGTTVFGGLLVATILSLFVVPTLFVVVKRIFSGGSRPPEIEAD